MVRNVDVTTTIANALADPGQVLARLKLYEDAEKKGRHTTYDMSILRYALGGYLRMSLDESDLSIINPNIKPYDDAVRVSGEYAPTEPPTGRGKGRSQKNEPWTVDIGYPAWLTSFFGPDDHLGLLDPEDTRSLAEALEMLARHVGLTTSPEAPTTDEPEDDEAEDDDDLDDDDEPFEDEDDTEEEGGGDQEEDDGDEGDEEDDELEEAVEDEPESDMTDDEADEGEGEGEDEEDDVEDEDDIRARSIPLPHDVRDPSNRPHTW